MACEKASVIQDIKKYIVVLRENGISVDKALLSDLGQKERHVKKVM